MPNIHTTLPTRQGEQTLAKRLRAFDDPQLHIWFALENLPGVPDIDILLWHEQVGVFVIEVKAIPLKMVRCFGRGSWEIEGRRSQKPPHIQAGDARDRLRELLERELNRPPFIIATACLPLITRREWHERFPLQSKIDDQIINGLIFDCDLNFGIDHFRQRLYEIWKSPPAKRGPKYPFTHNSDILCKVNLIINPEPQRSSGAPSDYERLRIIERAVTEEAVKLIPVNEKKRLFFSGVPGTGKTFRLLAIGMAHALAGKKVLFVCFNKTLASDVLRILRLSDQLRARMDSSDTEFDVYDISLFAKRYSSDLDYDDERDYLTWLECVYEAAASIDSIAPYDIVLIDEAQDMYQDGLRIVDLHICSETSICVAAGIGQELYGGLSFWLEDFQTSPDVQEVKLRRNFRNTLPVYQVAQVFYDSALDLERAKDYIKRYRIRGPNAEIQFDRPQGEWPIIVVADDAPLPWNDSYTFSFDLEQLMVSRYEEVINDQVEALSAKECPMDILVLVPSFDSMERKWAVTALEKVTHHHSHSIRFIDYTDNTNRRQPGHPDYIRLCTFASSRGLEGYRTILLGFETVERLCENTQQQFTNLGYIALSRAVFETVILRRTSRNKWRPVEHVVSCINLLKAHQEGASTPSAKRNR